MYLSLEDPLIISISQIDIPLGLRSARYNLAVLFPSVFSIWSGDDRCRIPPHHRDARSAWIRVCEMGQSHQRILPARLAFLKRNFFATGRYAGRRIAGQTLSFHSLPLFCASQQEKRRTCNFRKGKAEKILLPNPLRSNRRPQCPRVVRSWPWELICFIRLLANKRQDQENAWLVANVHDIAHFGGASGHR